MKPRHPPAPVLCALLATLACAAPPRAPAPEPAAPEPPRWRVLATSVEGRALELAEFGEGPLTVLVMASIHGDEAAGTPLVRELARRLVRSPSWLAGRRVLLLPEANPDGVRARTRHNARGVDLNRNFPADNWRSSARRGSTPLSEPESRAILELVEGRGVARILSLHQAADQIDYDGPARALAEAMAAASPLALERMGARPGSLGSWAGLDRGIPVVTIELPRSADDAGPAQLWDLYGAMLLEGVRHEVSAAPKRVR